MRIKKHYGRIEGFEGEMLIKIKGLKEKVDVSDEDCGSRPCFWARPDPGVFTQGQGYRQRSGKQGWLCGNREIRGCPNPKPAPTTST